MNIHSFIIIRLYLFTWLVFQIQQDLSICKGGVRFINWKSTNYCGEQEWKQIPQSWWDTGFKTTMSAPRFHTVILSVVFVLSSNFSVQCSRQSLKQAVCYMANDSKITSISILSSLFQILITNQNSHFWKTYITCILVTFYTR